MTTSGRLQILFVIKSYYCTWHLTCQHVFMFKIDMYQIEMLLFLYRCLHLNKCLIWKKLWNKALFSEINEWIFWSFENLLPFWSYSSSMFDYGAKIDVFSFKYFFNTLLVKPFKKLKEWLNGEKLPTLTRIPFSTNKRKMSRTALLQAWNSFSRFNVKPVKHKTKRWNSWVMDWNKKICLQHLKFLHDKWMVFVENMGKREGMLWCYAIWCINSMLTYMATCS